MISILIGQWIDVFLLFRFVMCRLQPNVFTLNYYKRCRWVESHSQEYIRVESRFDNSIDELSPILITGIVEMSPTLISRIFQCTQVTPHEGWPANLHYLTAFNLSIVIYILRSMIGLWQEFKTLWERWNLYFCYWPYTPCCLVVGNF